MHRKNRNLSVKMMKQKMSNSLKEMNVFINKIDE